MSEALSGAQDTALAQTNGEGADFSFSAIQNFDAHIAREIRGYELLDMLTQRLADAFIEDGTNVYDIGSSTGRLINTLASKLSEDPDGPRGVQFTGYEPNPSMTKNFVPYGANVNVVEEKVDELTEFRNASLVTSIFTLQFVPTHIRPTIIQHIHDGLLPNGAFIWAEKVIASDPKLESLINAQHLELKRDGCSAKDILDKDLRLRRIMRPLRLATNERMLEEAGFESHETFWRVNNFVAMIAVKST